MPKLAPAPPGGSAVVRVKAGLELREYQEPLYWALRNGTKRAVAVWHRRAGKDTTALLWTREAAVKRPGLYWHMLPTLRQGRQVIWDGVATAGDTGVARRLLDVWQGWRNPAAADSLVRHIRHDEMKVELINGSIWQVVGSDNYDSLLGANPVGVVFSEWPLTAPASWDFVRPILAENDGWALFIFTPRGRNHGWTVYDAASRDPAWFCEKLTVAETGAISLEAIEADRRSGMAEEIIQQEYFVSFDAPLFGSYYGDQMAAADKDGRLTKVAHDPAISVDTWWDLGRADKTAIWFVQHAFNEVRLIDYHESNGKTLQFYASLLQSLASDRGYLYGRHLWPHDGGHRTLASGGKALSELFGDLNVMVEVQPRQDVEAGIQQVRALLPRCWFDAERCRLGIEALRSYRKEEDEAKSTVGRRMFRATPLHDWSSHGADGFRTGASAWHGGDHKAHLRKRVRYSGETGTGGSAWTA
jgi:hypothetical protein